MKSEIKRELSRLRGFSAPKLSLEQYSTPPSLAADMLHTAYMQGDLSGKVVDLGSGTGILAIGAALLDAEVAAVEKDPDAIEILQENAGKLGVEIEIVETDIREFSREVDTVLMNPPFSHHSDAGIKFWGKALELGDAVYGLSPKEMRERIKDFAGNSSHEIRGVESYTISLPPSYGFHTEESHETEIDLVVTRR